MNSRAYEKLDYSLCLLSAAADGKRHGCIVNSFHQVTSSFPPKFTVAVNKDHETCKAVQAAGSFCVTLLAEDAVGIIQATGRVAVRQGMEGKRLFWVHPGDTVESHAKIVNRRANIVFVESSAYVNGNLSCSAHLTVALTKTTKG